MNNFKISKKNILLFFMVFFSLKIGCVSYLANSINFIWYVGQGLSIFLAFYYLLKKSKFNKFDFGVLLFYFILFISTITNKVGISNFVKDLISFSSIYFVMRYGIETDAKNYIKYVSNFLLLYTVINTFSTIILYPNAMFRDNSNPIFFMGGDNTAVRLYIISICFYVLNTYNKKNKVKIPLFQLVNLLIFSFVRDLGGGKICFVLLALGCIYLKYRPIFPKRLIKKIFLVNIVLFFLVVLLNKLNAFEFIIVNVLHRSLDLTGRTIIWEITLNKIIDKPILGYGMIDGLDFQAMLPYIIGVNAHNTYLMILFVGGIILFASFIYVFFIGANKFDSKSHMKYLYIIPISLLTLMVRAQIEGWDVIWIFIILLLAYSVDKLELINKSEE